MKEPSASNAGLAALCAHPWTSGIPWPAERSDRPVFGTRVHLGAEALVTGEPAFPAALAALDEAERDSLVRHVDQARRYLARVRPHVVFEAAELRIRYDVERGTTELQSTRGRLALGAWTTILDYAAALRDGRALVADYKTGRQASLEPASRNWQLRIGAVAFARHFGARRVRAELVHLEDDRFGVDAIEFSALELAEIAHEIRELRASLRRGPTPPVPGPHCTERFCPLRGVCGATVGALAAVIPLPRPLLPAVQSDDDARYLYDHIPLAKEALNALEHARDEWARTNPIRFEDGSIYTWREKERRSVSADTAEQRAALGRVLGTHGTTAVQTEYSVTIGGIERAAAAAVESSGDTTRGAKRRLAERALAALGEAGGVKVSRYQSPEKFRPSE